MSVSRRTILGGGTVVTMATSMLTARVAAQISTQDEIVELCPARRQTATARRLFEKSLTKPMMPCIPIAG
jgi:hypothetical protein